MVSVRSTIKGNKPMQDDTTHTPTQSAYSKHIEHLPWFTKALCWYMLAIELVGVLTIVLLCLGYRIV